MNSDKKTARIVGILFLSVLITFISGTFLLDSVLSATDYLLEISQNETKIMIGALLEIINGILYVSIAILLYPILKKYNESIAIGYVVFRIIEFVLQIVSDISPLILITLSQEYVQAGTPVNSYFQTSGELLLIMRYWGFQIGAISFAFSAILLNYALYQTKLIPRFLSTWGLIAAILVLISTTVVFFGLIFNLDIVFGLPMLLNEIFLGVWLIVKGFNTSVISSEATNNS